MAAVVAPDENITAYCKVCKTLVEHAVVAVKGKRPNRVQCRTCEDTHPYRASMPSPKNKAGGAAKLKGSPRGDGSYDSLMKGRDLSQTTKYAMTLQFGDNDLINHDAFGVGLVTRVLADRKIEVLFSNGAKMLAHGR